MKTEIKKYNGKTYIKIDNNRLVISSEDVNDLDLKIVEGHLDVIEIDNEKYVTKDYKLLYKLTPELEKYVYKNGDLDDILEMHEDDSDYGNLPEIRDLERSK